MRKTLNRGLLEDVTKAIESYNKTESNENKNELFTIGIRSVQSSTPRREKIKLATNKKLDEVERIAQK